MDGAAIQAVPLRRPRRAAPDDAGLGGMGVDDLRRKRQELAPELPRDAQVPPRTDRATEAGEAHDTDAASLELLREVTLPGLGSAREDTQLVAAGDEQRIGGQDLARGAAQVQPRQDTGDPHASWTVWRSRTSSTIAARGTLVARQAQRTRACEVGDPVAHVAEARRDGAFRVDVPDDGTCEALARGALDDELREVLDARAGVAAEVQGPAGERGTTAERERRDVARDVVDVGQGADLRAVAVDLQRQAPARRFDEAGQHHAAGRVLARSDDVEETQVDGGELRRPEVARGVEAQLARPLRGGVGPAPGVLAAQR
jgi:hypothetical protein